MSSYQMTIGLFGATCFALGAMMVLSIVVVFVAFTNKLGGRRVICPECKEQGLKSKVYIGASTATLMGVTRFYDGEGNHHCHDPNTTTTSYVCTNGHMWQGRSQDKCWCGWPDNDKEDSNGSL